MTSRQSLTDLIRSMYEVFPFPNCEYERTQGMQLAMYFAKQAKKSGSRSLLAEGVSVVDCGCGTGSTIIPIAKAYPQSQFLGVDMTSKSLEIATQAAKDQGVTNISFVQADLQTFDLKRKFDVVLNFGVLIVVADPMAALERLTAHVAPEGRLVLWLYGTHGRYKLRLNQRAMALLTKDTDDWKERMEIGKRALAHLPRKHWDCYFSVPTYKLENKFEEGFDWIQTNESWIADQFLHPHEKSFEMEGILDMFDKVGLRFDHWIGVDTDIANYTTDEDLRARVRALPEKDRLLFFDLLHKPVDYFVVGRHKDAK